MTEEEKSRSIDRTKRAADRSAAVEKEDEKMTQRKGSEMTDATVQDTQHINFKIEVPQKPKTDDKIKEPLQKMEKKNMATKHATVMKSTQSPSMSKRSSKPIVPNIGTTEQNMKNLELFNKTMHDQKQAKKEEDEYLKLRKQQLLMDCLPKTKAAKLRQTDDKFPSSIFKQMEKWNFGAMKAKYLAMRPNGKFATWFGKNHKEHRREVRPSLRERVKFARFHIFGNVSNQLAKDAEEAIKVKKETSKEVLQHMQNHKVKEVKQAQKDLPSLPEPMKKSESTVEYKGPQLELDEEDIIINTRYSRPLNERGVPFWMEERGEGETEEDAEVVNKESITEYGSLAMKLPRIERAKIPFDMTSSINSLAQLDKKFESKLVFMSTIQNVLCIWKRDGELANMTLPPVQPRKVTIANHIVISEYESGVENINHNRGFKTKKEPIPAES